MTLTEWMERSRRNRAATLLTRKLEEAEKKGRKSVLIPLDLVETTIKALKGDE